MTHAHFMTVCRHSDLRADQKALAVIIDSFTDRRGICRPTRAALMQRAGFSKNKLERDLQTLRIAGLLNMERVRDEKGRVRTIFVLFPPKPTFIQNLSDHKDGPYPLFADKGLIPTVGIRVSGFTHARAREEIRQHRAMQQNGNSPKSNGSHAHSKK